MRCVCQGTVQAYVYAALKADSSGYADRGLSMVERAVQCGVVAAPDAVVGSGSPGFYSTWQSKDDVRQQAVKEAGVSNNAELYFWDRQL